MEYGVTAGNLAENWAMSGCRCFVRWWERVKRASVNDVSSLCSRLGKSTADQLHRDCELYRVAYRYLGEAFIMTSEYGRK